MRFAEGVGSTGQSPLSRSVVQGVRVGHAHSLLPFLAFCLLTWLLQIFRNTHFSNIRKKSNNLEAALMRRLAVFCPGCRSCDARTLDMQYLHE